jgi:hypothetical protein
VDVVITLPRPTGDPKQDSQNYVEYVQKVAKAEWEAGKKYGWKDSPLTAEQFKKMLANGTADKSLLGVVVWGHGGKDGFLLNASVNGKEGADKYIVTWDRWGFSQNYKLGLGIIYACRGGYAQSAERIKDGTNVFSTTGIFWGTDNTLIPPLALPAVEKVLRKLPQIDFPNVEVTIKPPSVAKIISDNKDVK